MRLATPPESLRQSFPQAGSFVFPWVFSYVANGSGRDCVNMDIKTPINSKNDRLTSIRNDFLLMPVQTWLPWIGNGMSAIKPRGVQSAKPSIQLHILLGYQPTS